MFDLDAAIKPLPADSLHVVPATSPAAAKALRRHLRRVERRRFIRLEGRRAAIELLRPLPAPDEALHGTMDGRFSAWSLAEAIVELQGEPVRELTISTLGYNRQNAASLVEMLDAGKVQSVLLNVSNYFRHSDREIFSDIRRELESRGQRVAVTRSHAKLLLAKSERHAIVCEMSANLRRSANYEQFVINDDRELLQFHRQWIEELCQAQASDQ